MAWTWIRENILTRDQGEQRDVMIVGYGYKWEPLCLL